MTKQNNTNYDSREAKRERASAAANNSYKNDSFLRSPLFIAVAFTIIGFTAATFIYKTAQDRQKDLFIQDIYAAKDSDGIIETIRRNRNLFVTNLDHDFAALEREARAKFLHHQDLVKEAINNGSDSSGSARVSTREDDKNYFYELKFSGFDKDEIMVKTDNGMINFSANTKKEVNDKSRKSSTSSSFSYSFVVPNYDKKVKPEIIKEDDRITVKFTKLKSKS